jgi:hypothetical protein
MSGFQAENEYLQRDIGIGGLVAAQLSHSVGCRAPEAYGSRVSER